MQAKNKRPITVVHRENFASKLYCKNGFSSKVSAFLYPPFPVFSSFRASFPPLLTSPVAGGSKRPPCEDSSQAKAELSRPIPSSHFLPW